MTPGDGENVRPGRRLAARILGDIGVLAALAAMAVVVAAVLGSLMMWLIGVFAPGPVWPAAAEPVDFFDERDEFDEAASWVKANALDYEYALDLPAEYAGLTTQGFVSVSGSIVFFPQWMGIPDDAGGYVYAPDGNPTQIDLYGSRCQNLTHLDGDWWSCSMNDDWLERIGA